MNHNKKALNSQQRIIVKNLNNTEEDTLYNLVTHPDLVLEDLPEFRHRIYTPMRSLSMFISQALNPDGSCQKVVDDLALRRSVSDDNLCSVSTGAYCKARKRLPESMIVSLTKQVALINEKKVKKAWKFRGRDVYLVDGTTLTMADTIKNQESYPQPHFQKEGLGFPICRIVGIISLTSGSLINAAVSAYSGKETGEQSLLRGMLSTFKKGDIILADALYSTYALLAYVIEKGIDIVFVQNGARSRKTDFTQGEVLGKNDHLITLKKPKSKSEWMTQEMFDSLPNTIIIRELKAGGKTLITTMLCPKTTSVKTLKDLYKKRWNIEVDFRDIKTTLGLETLNCKTPEMVLKELWIHFLAYNLIRYLMLESAIYNKVFPRQISFKHSLQLFASYSIQLNDIYNFQNLLILIGGKRIGNRGGRIEPRLLKRRNSSYKLMMQPRNISREEVRKNGHP